MYVYIHTLCVYIYIYICIYIYIEREIYINTPHLPLSERLDSWPAEAGAQSVGEMHRKPWMLGEVFVHLD